VQRNISSHHPNIIEMIQAIRSMMIVTYLVWMVLAHLIWSSI